MHCVTPSLGTSVTAGAAHKLIRHVITYSLTTKCIITYSLITKCIITYSLTTKCIITYSLTTKWIITKYFISNVSSLLTCINTNDDTINQSHALVRSGVYQQQPAVSVVTKQRGDCGGLLVTVVVCWWLWWSVGDCGGLWVTVVICGWFWWSVSDCGGLWVTVMVCGWLWFSVGEYGGLWVSVVVCGRYYIESDLPHWGCSKLWSKLLSLHGFCYMPYSFAPNRYIASSVFNQVSPFNFQKTNKMLTMSPRHKNYNVCKENKGLIFSHFLIYCIEIWKNKFSLVFVHNISVFNKKKHLENFENIWL